MSWRNTHSADQTVDSHHQFFLLAHLCLTEALLLTLIILPPAISIGLAARLCDMWGGCWELCPIALPHAQSPGGLSISCRRGQEAWLLPGPGWVRGLWRGMTSPAPQAEEELIKAQKVFEEMNVDLQEELPSLWNR